MSRPYKPQNTRPGFTMVELSLAIAFIGVLLLSVAYITLEISNSYQKGLAIKAVAATGRDLIDNFSRDNFSRAIFSSPAALPVAACSQLATPAAKNDCIADNAYRLTYQQYYGSVTIGTRTYNNVPLSGAFCTGRYSYLWNSGYVLNPSAASSPLPAVLRTGLTTTSGSRADAYHLLVIEDPLRSVCASNLQDDYYNATAPDTFTTTLTTPAIELLSPSEDNLAVYDFVLFRPTQHHRTLHAFYSAAFTLATVAGGVDITASGDYCTDVPDGLATDYNYCAINKFNFAMRVTGETL